MAKKMGSAPLSLPNAGSEGLSFFAHTKRFLRNLWWGTPEISATYTVFGGIYATVDVLTFEKDLVAGKPFDFQVRVTNSENGPWPQHGKIDLHLRWTTPNSDGTDSLLTESWRHRLPCLYPGEFELIQAMSMVPENAPPEVFVEFYISSLEGVWRKGIGRETRFTRTVKPAAQILHFPKSAQNQSNPGQASRAA